MSDPCAIGDWQYVIYSILGSFIFISEALGWIKSVKSNSITEFFYESGKQYIMKKNNTSSDENNTKV